MKNNKYFEIISETILKPYFEGNIKSRGADYVWHMMCYLWKQNFSEDFHEDLDTDKVVKPEGFTESVDADSAIAMLKIAMDQFNKDVRTDPPLMMWEQAPSGFHYRTNYHKTEKPEEKQEEKPEEKPEEKQDEVPAVEEETDVKVDSKAVEAAMNPKAEESVIKFINSLQGSFAELLNSLDEKDKKELQEVLDKAGLNEDLVKKIKEMINSHEEKIDGSTEAAMLPNFSGLVANYVPQPAIGYTPQQAALTPEQRAIIMQQQAMANAAEQVPQVAPNPVMKTPVTPEIHRVDNPNPKPKKVNTGVEDPNVVVKLGKINMKGLKAEKEKSEIPEVVNNNLPKGTPVSDVAALDHNSIDNSEMIKKYPKVPLKEIQDIANENGCNVYFNEIDGRKGIILIDVADEGNNLRPEKGFTIDTGMIIDRRLKLYPVSLTIDPYSPLEVYPAYELMYSDKNNHNKTVLDRKLISDIMIAGVGNIQKRSMYSEEYRKLNLKVALITMPLKGLNAEERGSLQKFLLAMDKQGYLDKAIKAAPGSRFVFADKQLNKSELSTFTLVNCDINNPSDSVPVFYGAITAPVNPIIIRVKKGNVEMEGSIPLQQHGDGCTCDECKKHHSVA